MSSNYQQKKMMNALGAIDTKGNIVLEQFQDGTALLFQPGNAQPFCVATDYDRATASWSYGKCKAATLGSNALKTRSNTVGISKTQNADRTAHTEHIE